MLVSLGVTESPVKIEFAPGAGLDELKKAVIAEFRLGAAPARVRLLLKTDGSGTLVPLDSRKQVAQMEQCVEGTCVAVEVQAHSECLDAFASTPSPTLLNGANTSTLRTMHFPRSH